MGIMDKIKRATGTDEQYDDITTGLTITAMPEWTLRPSR